MSFFRREYERDDEIRAARAAEEARVRRWDAALKARSTSPLGRYLASGGHRLPPLKPVSRLRYGLDRIRMPRINMPSVHLPDLTALHLPTNARRALLLATAAPATAVAALTAVVQFGESPLVAEAKMKADCAAAQMLVLPEGTPVIMPGNPGNGCTTARSHLYVPSEDPEVIEARADKIAVLEGAYRRARTFYGLDPRGPVRFLVKRTGFSSPILSAFETTLGRPASLRANPLLKIRHVIASMQYTRIHLNTDAKRASFIVHHMPIVSNIGLDPVAGPYAEALLFGEGANERTLAQECMLAAAAGFPLKLAPSELVRALRWNKARTRAHACVTASARSQAEADAAREEIASATMPDAVLAESIDPDILRTLRAFARHNAAAREEPILHLTLPRDMQSSLSASARERLAGFDRVHETGFCAKGDCEPKADALVAIAEITDDALALRAVVSTRTGLLFGPARRDGEAWVALPDRLGNASLNKLLVSLPQARSGNFMLCNLALPGFRNVSGPDGVEACDPATGEGMVSAREALKLSMNLPWIDAARRYRDEITGIEDSLGYVPAATPETAPQMALGFGRYGAPAVMIEFAAALVGGGKSAPFSPLVTPAQDGFDAEALGYGPPQGAREVVGGQPY